MSENVLNNNNCNKNYLCTRQQHNNCNKEILNKMQTLTFQAIKKVSKIKIIKNIITKCKQMNNMICKMT